MHFPPDIPLYSKCLFLCCRKLWRRLNQFKKFQKICVISSDPSWKAFIPSVDDTEILTNLICDLCQFLFPAENHCLCHSWWLSLQVQMGARMHTSARTACMYTAWVMCRSVCVCVCVCWLLPTRPKACRAPVTWYVGRDQNAGLTAKSPPPLTLTDSPVTSAASRNNTWVLLPLQRLSFQAPYNNFWGKTSKKKHFHRTGEQGKARWEEITAFLGQQHGDADKLLFLKATVKSTKVFRYHRCIEPKHTWLCMYHYKPFLSSSLCSHCST